MLEPRPLGMGGVAGQWPYRNMPTPSVILQTWSFYVKQYERNYGEFPEKNESRVTQGHRNQFGSIAYL